MSEIHHGRRPDTKHGISDHESKKLALDTIPEECEKEWNRRKDELTVEALTAYKDAVSWRDFHVGCAMLSYNKHAKKYFTHQGRNFKPKENVETICAEKVALDCVEPNEDTVIVGMVIVSTRTQPDFKNAIDSDILYPCDKCRTMFAKNAMIKPWTNILLIRANEKIDIDNASKSGFDEERSKIYDPAKIGELSTKTIETNCASLIRGIRRGLIKTPTKPRHKLP